MEKQTSNSPTRPFTPEQLRQLTADQLHDLAGRLGLPPRKGDHDSEKLVEIIVARQQLVAQLDRSVLAELAKWGHLQIGESADMVELAAAVAKLRKMRFAGLSPEALRALAHLRGVTFAPNADDGTVINRLKGREGLRGLLARKRRRLMAKLVAG
ncbi:MAG: hypothetical protein HQ546_11635, partial [Planctomycetes bacterium]|nr:hypothetical protein [Planctomycetota bacterium]